MLKICGGSYQSLSHLMNNETTGIKFDTLEKICDILSCEPGDVIIRKKYLKRKKVNKHEQTSKSI